MSGQECSKRSTAQVSSSYLVILIRKAEIAEGSLFPKRERIYEVAYQESC
jgi:hypothetical protein